MKKCTICGDAAVYCIKNSSECYCEECAKEHFCDLSYLVTVEEEALRLKKLIEDKIEEE